MKTAIILAAGAGTRIWPFAAVRPKPLIPLANRPIIAHIMESAREAGVERFVVAASAEAPYTERMRNVFRGDESVEVVPVAGSRGTAHTLLSALDQADVASALVLHGDVLISAADLSALITRFEAGAPAGVACLLEPIDGQDTRDWVCCSLRDATVRDIVGHPRGTSSHRFCAFAVGNSFRRYLSTNSGIFSRVEVGTMPPVESYLEMSIADAIEDGFDVPAVATTGPRFDIDKPWHILEANGYLVRRMTASIAQNELGEGASIDASASIGGHVRLGRGSRIGRNVTVSGSLIVGDGSVVDNGAIIDGSAVLGDGCSVSNYCYIADGSTVGNRCVVNHCAELDGVIFDNVYLYHYMEFYGVLGESSDLGAATVCGSLRFDDGVTVQRVKGRREIPRAFSQASYLGDHVRTGVNAIIMPGRKVGAYSVVGPGVVLNEDLPERTVIMVEQQLKRTSWGPERYGW